jgi:hypothetical protein
MLRFPVRPLRLAVPAAAFVAAGFLVGGLSDFTQAAEISDDVGDILPAYDGAALPGMDVVAHQVTLVGDRVVFYGRMAGPIAPTQAIGGLYLFGLDRGQGTPRFLGPAAPPVIGPNVLWDSIVRINPNGTGLFNNSITGVVTPLDPADIVIDGDELTASVPVSLLSTSATRAPCEWTYNLWPRNGIGRNVQVSDLAPDDGNSPMQTIPEVSSVTDLASLWPPNHKMREVGVFIAASDACKGPSELMLLVTVSSNEPDDAPGDGDGGSAGDTDGEDGFAAPVDVTEAFTYNPASGGFEGSVLLRAERDEAGDGRSYMIEAGVLNDDFNGATSSCVVVVPYDRSP